MLSAAVIVATAGQESNPAAESVGDEEAIQQLLVQMIVAQRPAWHGYSADTFCVVLGRLEWKDGLLDPPTGPSDPFLSRVAAPNVTVLPARGCRMVSMGVDSPGVVVTSTERPAFFVTVGNVALRAHNRAEVRAGFVCGAMCASGQTYMLEKRSGSWVVVGVKNWVIS